MSEHSFCTASLNDGVPSTITQPLVEGDTVVFDLNNLNIYDPNMPCIALYGPLKHFYEAISLEKQVAPVRGAVLFCMVLCHYGQGKACFKYAMSFFKLESSHSMHLPSFELKTG